MSFTVAWDNEQKSILLERISGAWEWSAFYETQLKVVEIIRAEPRTVHLIVDIRESAPQVKGNALEQFRAVLDIAPANLGLLILVGRGYFLTRLFLSVVRLYTRMNRRTICVNSLEQAYAMLASQASELPVGKLG